MTDRPPGESDKALRLQLELALPEGGAAAASPPIARRQPRRAAAAIAVLVALAATGLLLFLVVLPSTIRHRCIDEADARGIVLTIGTVKLEPGGFRLLEVGASVRAVPGATAVAGEVEVKTAGLRPETLIAHEVDLTLVGSWNALASALDTWQEGWRQRPPASDETTPSDDARSAWWPSSLTIASAHLGWQDPFADTAKIEANGLHVQAVAKHGDQFLQATSDDVRAVVPGGALGPWRVDIDRTPGSCRVRVALDPGVPEASTVLYVRDGVGGASLDAVVPRSPLQRLGISPGALGLHGESLQFEATVHYTERSSGHAEATVGGGLYGVQAPPLPGAADLRWEGGASGDSRDGLDLKQARLSIGPLAGAVRGTLRTYPTGFRVDVVWTASPPCATASLTFDSRDLAMTTIALTPESSCNFARLPWPQR